MADRRVDLPGHTARTHRLEDAKEAHEEESRFKGKSVFTTPQTTEPTDLDAALRSLVDLMVPCAGASCGRPATRKVLGMVEARAGRQTAEVALCDRCEPPADSPFARYRWGLPYDLPYAGEVRFLLRHLEQAGGPTT